MTEVWLRITEHLRCVPDKKNGPCGYLHYFNEVKEMQGLVHFHFSGRFVLLRVVLGWFGFCLSSALSVHWPVVFPVSFGLPVTGSFYLRLGLGQNGITEAIQFLVVTQVRQQGHLEAQQLHSTTMSLFCFWPIMALNFIVKAPDFSILLSSETSKKAFHYLRSFWFVTNLYDNPFCRMVL